MNATLLPALLLRAMSEAQAAPRPELDPVPPPPAGDETRVRARSFGLSLGVAAGGVGDPVWLSPSYSAIVEVGTSRFSIGAGVSGAPLVLIQGPVDYVMPLFAGVEVDAMFGAERWRAGPSLATWLFLPVGLGARLVVAGPPAGRKPAVGGEFRAYWLHHFVPNFIGPEGEGWLVSAAVAVEWSFSPR